MVWSRRARAGGRATWPGSGGRVRLPRPHARSDVRRRSADTRSRPGVSAEPAPAALMSPDRGGSLSASCATATMCWPRSEMTLFSPTPRSLGGKQSACAPAVTNATTLSSGPSFRSTITPRHSPSTPLRHGCDADNGRSPCVAHVRAELPRRPARHRRARHILRQMLRDPSRRERVSVSSRSIHRGMARQRRRTSAMAETSGGRGAADSARRRKRGGDLVSLTHTADRRLRCSSVSANGP